jgi:hypothetical protein
MPYGYILHTAGKGLVHTSKAKQVLPCLGSQCEHNAVNSCRELQRTMLINAFPSQTAVVTFHYAI